MKTSFYPIVIAICFASCRAEKETETLKNSTVEASMDLVKLDEGGNSALTYNSKTKENVVVWTEWYILDMPVSDLGSALREDDVKPAGGEAGSQIGLRYGLEYIGKGAKFPFTGGSNSINLNYLEVPIDVIYHLPAGPGRVEAGLGPYFAYGIGGSTNGVSSFGQNNGGFKRFDAGLNLQAGYKFENGFSVRLGYDLGLANVEYADEDVKGHTRAFSINLGYQIGRLFGKK